MESIYKYDYGQVLGGDDGDDGGKGEDSRFIG